MLLGGVGVLVATAVPVGQMHTGVDYWRRALTESYPSVMIPLAVFNTGLAMMIGYMACAIFGRFSPRRIGCYVWIVLTAVEAIAIALFVGS